MANVIQPSAFLWFCPDCGQHGHLVLSNGFKGPEFYSKNAALGFLGGALKFGDIKEHEFLAMEAQIRNIDLPQRLTDDDLAVAAEIISSATTSLSLVELTEAVSSFRQADSRPPDCLN